MRSRIPLYGLPHKVDILRYVDADDGAGGIALGAATTIYSARRARITTMTDTDNQMGFGNAAGRDWGVILPHSPNIQRSDVVMLSASSKAAPIPLNEKYRVVWYKHQEDEQGGFHHTSLTIRWMETDHSGLNPGG